MTDSNRDVGETDPGTDAEYDGDEQDGDEHEVERVLTREDGATVLRRLADDVATGTVTLEADDAITVSVPERFELEVEYEQDDEEAELEVELEWPIVDGEAVAAEREVADGDETDTGDETDATEVDEDAAVADSSDDVAAADADSSGSAADFLAAGETASKAQFELYRDSAGEWRWRLVHDNGNIIADSGEGYTRKAGARQGLESVMRNAPGAAVVETNE